MPTNVSLLFSLITGIVNFKLFPTDGAIRVLLGLKEDLTAAASVSPEAKTAGYESSNLLLNMGLVFLGALALAVLAALLVLLKYIAVRY